MNIKKKLGRQADDYLDQFENEKFHQEVKEELFPQPTRARKRIRPKQVWIGFATTMAIACVVLVCCLTLLTPSAVQPSDNPIKPPEKVYFFENEEQENGVLSQVNASLENQFEFNDLTYEIIRKYDSVSNDTLYYRLKYNNEDMLESLLITIYTNKDYKFEWKEEQATLTGSVDDLEVKYSISYNDTGFYFEVKTYSFITLDNAKIYVEYNGVSLDGQSNNFLEALAQIIK